jgi:hypothetical protein
VRVDVRLPICPLRAPARPVRPFGWFAPLLLSTACTTSSLAPTDASPSTPPPIQSFTLQGAVTATNGGQPIRGATVNVDGVSATTDDGGQYALTVQADRATRLPISISGDGLVTRRVFVFPFETPDIDTIRQSNGFDLGFYRQLVRGAFETPGAMHPLDRWVRPPVFLIRTIDEEGRAIDGKSLNIAAAAVRDAVGPWTGGRFAPIVELGPEVRTTDDVVMVRWRSPVEAGYCGQAAIAGGVIWLNYQNRDCGCSGSRIRPRTVKHEVGHVMGFWHTDRADDVMYPAIRSCDADLSPRERTHAAIAYRRPVGNTDADSDPEEQGARQVRPLMPSGAGASVHRLAERHPRVVAD